MFKTQFRILLCVLVLPLLYSCTNSLILYPKASGVYQNDGAVIDNVSFWNDIEELQSKQRSKILVNLREQKAYFYIANKLAGICLISSGKIGYETPKGTFRIYEMDKDHSSNLYGRHVRTTDLLIVNHDATPKDSIPEGCYYDPAPMSYFMRFNRGIGFHLGFIPGYNASHGCLRMSEKVAHKFFEHATIGTEIIIQ